MNQVVSRYVCPDCKHEWTEVWDSACDSECPECGVNNISPTDWIEAKEMWELIDEVC